MWEIKTLFYQEVFSRGILTLGSHNLSFKHSDSDVTQLLSVYSDVFEIIADAVERKDLEKRLRCEVLKPLFRVR